LIGVAAGRGGDLLPRRARQHRVVDQGRVPVVLGDHLAERDQLEVLGGGQRRVVLRVEAAVIVPLAVGLQGRDGPRHSVAVVERLVAVQDIRERDLGRLVVRGLAGHRVTSNLTASAR
jgi:hypothetical protein